ncbi:MAG: FHA domain-containing protein [Planctomycetes bacterium]|nr:FHA domain-containing protein [Planctomycetota bacterium]
MFEKLQFVRLRAAEKAQRDGRIDEAYRLASASDLRVHKRGAAVLASLTEAFVTRARDYYRDDKFTEALMDLDRAESGGGMEREIAELRGYVRTVAAEKVRQVESRRRRLDVAQKRIERGSLAAGRDMLERAGNSDVAAGELRQQATERARDARHAIEHAERLLNSGQYADAAECVLRAKSIDSHNEAVARVEAQLCSRVLENAQAAFQEGSLGRAQSELACLGSLGKGLPQRRELKDLLLIAVEVGKCLDRNQYADARRHAMSLARRVPNAKWIETAIEQTQKLEELRTLVAAGPFGDKLNLSSAGSGKRGKAPASLDDTVALPAVKGAASGLPERLLLLVDGGGSYLILRGAQASVGRAASDTPADIPLFSDVAERHANITRVEDDYFLFSARDVEVGGRRTQHELLKDGDRVVLGRKAKFTFRLPSRQSSTALLELSDTTKMANDVRRIVLFNHHAIVGSGRGAHIFCRHAGPTLVLFERSGAMWIRAKSDGHVDTEAQPLRLGESIEIGGVSLVLQAWPEAVPGAPSI